MAQKSTDTTNLFWAVNSAIQLLTHDLEVQETVPQSLLLLSKKFDFESLVYLPIIPSSNEKIGVNFQPLLEIKKNEKKYHHLPDIVLEKQHNNSQIIGILQNLCSISGTVFQAHESNGKTKNPKDADILFISGHADVFDKPELGGDWQALIKHLGFDFNYFLLFPLVVQKKCWGIVCLTSKAEKAPWTLDQFLALGTYCTTLSNFLVRQETEVRLRVQRDYLRRTIDLNPNLIFVKNPNSKVIISNKTHANFHGMKPAEMEGKQMNELLEDTAEIKRIEIRDKGIWDGTEAFKSIVEQVYNHEEKARWLHTSLTPFVNPKTGKVEEVVGVSVDITARKETELALRESEHKLSSLIEDTKVGIWEYFVRENKLIVNQNCLDMAGLPKGDFQQPLEHFTQRIDPSNFDVLVEAFKNHDANKTPFYQGDIRLSRPDGSWRWLQMHGRILDQDEEGNVLKVSGSLIDIHDRKEASLLLKGNEMLLKATLDTLPDIKIRLTSDGEIRSVYAPQQDQQMLKFQPNEMIGKNLRECLPPFIAHGLLHNAKLARDTREVQTLEFVESPTENSTFFEARISTITEEESIIVLRNISPLKHAEKDLTEKIRELDIKNKELHTYIESNLQLENFAYIASHDLREPVRTMRSFAQVLEKHLGDKLDDDARMYLQFINNGANQMNQLIEDLLTYSRVNSDPMEKEEINLPLLLEDIKQSLNISMDEAGAKITTYNLPNRIVGSATRIRQLFQNLIANALKFRKKDQAPLIHIECLEDDRQWEFSISDNGIGIRRDFHEQIFKLFKKLHTRVEFQGTGIGLALCKKIIEMHNGEIWLESEEGIGTSFYFTLEK